MSKNIPDYSNCKGRFTFYAYSSMHDGTMSANGKRFIIDEDFRTLERFQEYKDCGFDVYFPQSVVIFIDDMLKTLDTAEKVGLKVLLTDNFFLDLARYERDFVGEGLEYATQEDFEKATLDRLNLYCNHPAFYGIITMDEATTTAMNSGAYERVYRTLKKVKPDLHIHANIRSIGGSYQQATATVNGIFPEVSKEFISNLSGVPVNDPFFTRKVDRYLVSKTGNERDILQMPFCAERFRLYCEKFFDTTDAPFIAIDAYPLYESGVMSHYLLAFQVANEVCKKRGKKLHAVSQTISIRPGGNPNNRILSVHDLNWLNNSLLAFGVKNIGYFTYITRGGDGYNTFVPASSFLTRYGEKTHIYYAMQKILADNQKFAPTFFEFDYSTSRSYNVPDNNYPNYYSVALYQGEFTKLKKVELDRECALVTEFKNQKDGRFMYAFMNVIDAQYQGADTVETITATFGSEYSDVLVYKNGEFKSYPLDNGKFTMTLRPGYAYYVIPY